MRGFCCISRDLFTTRTTASVTPLFLDIASLWAVTLSMHTHVDRAFKLLNIDCVLRRGKLEELREKREMKEKKTAYRNLYATLMLILSFQREHWSCAHLIGHRPRWSPLRILDPAIFSPANDAWTRKVSRGYLANAIRRPPGKTTTQ